MNFPLLSHSTQIVHCGHHKCGSVWVAYVIAAIAKKYDKKYVTIGDDPYLTHYPDGDFLYSYTSLVTFNTLNYISSHLVRDPRDVVISAYYYHCCCVEDWSVDFNPEFGMTYQEKLKSLSEEDGILFEMNHYTKNVLDIMSQWNYNDPKCMEMHYEDLISNPDKEFTKLFSHWGIDSKDIDSCLAVAKEYHMEILTGRKLGEIQFGSHMRNGLSGQWKQHFSEAHKIYFKSIFGDLLVKLGYEKDNKW